MKVAFGMKAHSGWAALVAIGERDGDSPQRGAKCPTEPARTFVVVDRRRIELVEEKWAKNPYHAAEGMTPDAAREVVGRAVESAHRLAVREMQAAIDRERDRNNRVTACAVLVTNPMPDWTVEEIIAVHFRMHKAEGVLFREALALATTACGLRSVTIKEGVLMNTAETALGIRESGIVKMMTALGKSVGPPWGKDQKDAALSAMVAMRGDRDAGGSR